MGKIIDVDFINKKINYTYEDKILYLPETTKEVESFNKITEAITVVRSNVFEIRLSYSSKSIIYKLLSLIESSIRKRTFRV